jgi:hypothetical protein
MRLFWIAAIFILSNHLVMSQNLSADQIVQKQLEAYNSGNIDEFMSVFHTEIELWQLGGEKPIAKGFEAVRNIYKNLFENSPQLNSVVINRSVIGNKVIDYERITGRNGNSEPLYLMMIYEIKDQKIHKAYSIRE